MLSGAGALITGTVSTSVSAVGAAVAFVMSRVAMFLATVAVWAGAGDRGGFCFFGWFGRARVADTNGGCHHGWCDCFDAECVEGVER